MFKLQKIGFAPRATIEVSSPQEHAALAKCDEDYNRKRDPNANLKSLELAIQFNGGGGPPNYKNGQKKR